MLGGPLIVIAPPATGKTVNSEVIKKELGCSRVFDLGRSALQDLPKDLTSADLILSTYHPKDPKNKRKYLKGTLMSLDLVKYLCKDNWIEPKETS